MIQTSSPRSGRRRARAAAALLSLCVILPIAASHAKETGTTDWPGTLEGHGGPVKSVALRGHEALTASFDYAAVLWDLSGAAPREVHRLIGHRAAVNDAAFAGDRAVTVSDDGAAMIWDLASGAALARHETGGEKAMAVAVSPDGTLAASAHWDNRARLYDTATGALTATLEGHRDNVNDVAFSLDGTHVLTASYDGTIREWGTDGTGPRPLHDHGWGVNVIVPVMRGGEEWLVFGALDGTLGALPLADPARVETVL